MQPCSEARLA